MVNSSERAAIAEHCLENERNLHLASKISGAFSEVRQRVVAGFIRDLKTEVKSRLGRSWQVDQNCEHDALTSGWLLEAQKTDWGGRCSICLEGAKDGPAEVDLYVWLASKTPKQALLRSVLKEALRENYGVGRKLKGNCVWYLYLEPPYRDWTTEEALALLYRKTEAIGQIASQVESLCRIAAPIVDRHLKPKMAHR